MAKTDPVVTDEEMTVLEEQSAASEDFYVHKFKKPFTYCGKTYETLTFDFESLTGQDSLSIEEEIIRLGKPLVVRSFSGEYQVRVAARACTDKIGDDLLRALPIAEYHKIVDKTKGFLLRSEL